MQHVLWLSDIDTKLHTSLSKHGRMLAELTQAKFPLPPGFLITTEAYFAFLQKNILDHKIRQLLSTVSFDLTDSLMQAEPHIKRLFAQTKLSSELKKELADFYRKIGGTVILEVHMTGKHAVKHKTIHATTTDNFIDEVKNAWAAMFTTQALWHRNQHKLDHLRTGVEIIVQKKIVGNKKGKVFTIDPTTHAKDRLFIITQTPHEGDKYVLSKKTLAIIDRELKHQTNLSKLTHDELLAIGKIAKEVEQHLYFPQEMTWAIDGENVYLIHAQPVSTLPQTKVEKKRKLPIARGKGITTTIGTGITNIIQSLNDLHTVKEHDVIVIAEIKPIHLPYIKNIRGLLVEKGHQHTEVATRLRHQGIPTIFNVKDATKHLRSGNVITVHAGKGEIYGGGLV